MCINLYSIISNTVAVQETNDDHPDGGMPTDQIVHGTYVRAYVWYMTAQELVDIVRMEFSGIKCVVTNMYICMIKD